MVMSIATIDQESGMSSKIKSAKENKQKQFSLYGSFESVLICGYAVLQYSYFLGKLKD